MEREPLEKALATADEINYKTTQIEEVRTVLSYDTQKFIQEQLKTANRLGDKARAIRLSIKLKEMFFGQFGKMFVFEQFSALRKPEDFAKAKLLGRDALKTGISIIQYCAMLLALLCSMIVCHMQECSNGQSNLCPHLLLCWTLCWLSKPLACSRIFWDSWETSSCLIHLHWYYLIFFRRAYVWQFRLLRYLY